MSSLCLYCTAISTLIQLQYLLEHFSQFAYASDIIGCNCTPLLCICIRHLLGIHISSDIPEECYDYSKSLFILTWFFYLDCFIAVWTSNINFQIVYPPNHLVLSFTIIVFVVVVVTDRISLDICLSSCYKYLDILSLDTVQNSPINLNHYGCMIGGKTKQSRRDTKTTHRLLGAFSLITRGTQESLPSHIISPRQFGTPLKFKSGGENFGE